MSFVTGITRGDFYDNIVGNFDLTHYFEKARLEIIDLAESLGIRDSDDIALPLHYKVKEYAISFIIKELCQDKSGTNNVETPDFEKYVVKFKMYNDKADKLRREISYEMLTGSIGELRDRAVVDSTLYRG